MACREEQIPDVGDYQVGRAVEHKRGKVFPVAISGILDPDLAAFLAGQSQCVEIGRTVVIDGPEQILSNTGVCESAGFPQGFALEVTREFDGRLLAGCPVCIGAGSQEDRSTDH